MKILQIWLLAVLLSVQLCGDELDKTNDRVSLERVALAISEFRVKNGRLPCGQNADVIAALTAPTIGVNYRPGKLSPSGELVGYDGRPFIFLQDGGNWCVVGSVDKDTDTFSDYVLIPPRRKSLTANVVPKGKTGENK